MKRLLSLLFLYPILGWSLVYVVEEGGNVYSYPGDVWSYKGNIGTSDAVALMLHDKDLYVVTKFGEIKKSIDEGVSWSDWGKVTCSDVVSGVIVKDTMFIITKYGEIAKSSITTANFEYKSCNASGIVGISATGAGDYIWVAQRTGKVAYSTDMGNSWTWKSGVLANNVTGITVTEGGNQDTVWVGLTTGELAYSTTAANFNTWTWVTTSIVSSGIIDVTRDENNRIVLLDQSGEVIVYSANLKGISSIGTTGQSGSMGGIAVRGSAFSVWMIDFYGMAGDRKAKLCWTVEADGDKIGYVIERALSREGKFEKIGTVPASGKYLYEFIDKELTNGTTYWYKLGGVFSTGGVEYHDRVISVTPVGFPLAELIIRAYPNPFDKKIHFKCVRIVVMQSSSSRFDNKYIGPCKLVIYDALGRVIKVFGGDVKGAYHLPFSYTWEVKDATSGTYFCNLVVKDVGTKSTKVILIGKE